MAGALVQTAISQSVPGGTFTNPQAVCLASATTAGNTLLAACALGYDTTTTSFTCTDTLGQTWTSLELQQVSGDYNFQFFIKQNSLALPAPIAFTFSGTVSSGATNKTLSTAWAGTTATYVVRFSTGECRPVLLTNGSTTTGGWGDGLGQAATASATAGYGPRFQATNDGDFAVATIAEVSGVNPSGTVVHNSLVNIGITAGNNNINAGSLACGGNTGIIIMLVDNVANGAGSPVYTPKVGTTPIAMTQFGSAFWNYGSGAGNAIWQYANGTFGTVTPTAGTQETASDDYFVFGVFLQDQPPAPPPPQGGMMFVLP